MENIKVIYVHLDFSKYSFSSKLDKNSFVCTELPDYASISISQSKKYFEEVVVLDSSFYKEEVEEFYNLCEVKFPSYSKDPFWFFTLARLYILLRHVKDTSITRFIHMEYDNLLYSDGKCLSDIPEGIYFTKVGPFIGSAGFVYCNSLSSVDIFLSSLVSLLSKGEGFLSNEISSSHLYEMEMIDYLKQKGDCDYLPLFPEDDYYNICNHVFDGASYGQYLGGTNNGHEKGWFGTHHYVGGKLSKDKIKIFYNKAPYIIQDNVKVNIFNLHLHNKKIIKEFK